MSTQPNGWQAPKTDWTPADGVADADFNRTEGNIKAIETGDRTVDPAQAPAGNVGTLRQLLDWFANRIVAITGAANWWDLPTLTLQGVRNWLEAIDADILGHKNATTVHGAVSTATANRIILRDPNGRAKVTAPSAADDIARKDTVDGLKTTANTWTQRQTFNGGLSDGDSNADTSLLMALGVPIDTRSWTATAWTADNKPTHIDIKDGAAVVGTLDVTYNANGKPTQVVAVAGGKTITYTINWTGDRYDGYTKAVV